MSYKCRICGSNEVDRPGDVCELCALGQDPYAAGIGGAQSRPSEQYSEPYAAQMPGSAVKRGNSRKVLIQGGASLQNTDPYGNSMAEDHSAPKVAVYSAGQVPASPQPVPAPIPAQPAKTSGGQPITSGITKNISLDNQKKPFLYKWFRSMFTGVPFALDDDITMFQVFPDFTGTALNAMGNACDQVIVYGKINNGVISENNEVEVYGRRDANNNILAKTIKNVATGTTITPQRTISAGIVWVITLIVLALVLCAVLALGTEGIIWAIVLILLFTNLPLTIKILGLLFGGLFSLLKRLF